MECDSNCPVPSSGQAVECGIIDAQALETLIASGIPFVILDARAGKWDDGKRIANAYSFKDVTEEEVAKVVPSKKALIVVYCSNVECPASSYLAKLLTDWGYAHILKYEGGIQEWMGSGRPVRSNP